MHDRLIWSTAMIVRAARVANRLVLLAIAAGFVATWAIPSFFTLMLVEADPAVDAPTALNGLRLLMLVGIAMAIAAAWLLASLAAIVASAGAGDPFVPANAGRLRTIGRALLALQLLDLPCIFLAGHWPSLGSAAPIGGISIGGWLATLMAFVLARVFAAGSALRDDLAGTV